MGMFQRRFPVGTRIQTVGCDYRTGRVIKPFDWRESTDPKSVEPTRRGDIAVKWDNGTIGYINGMWLSKISEKVRAFRG